MIPLYKREYINIIRTLANEEQYIKAWNRLKDKNEIYDGKLEQRKKALIEYEKYMVEKGLQPYKKK